MVGVSDLDLRLAPMAGVTNAPFRLVCRECGAGPLTSEEIDAHAYVRDNGKTEALTSYLPAERPLAMQLLGADPDVLAEAARRLEAAGADAIDLNMGCPVHKIVVKGHGSALMRDPLAAAVIFRTLRKAVTRVPFTIKIRSGWDERTLNAVEIARLAESEGVDAITVHPRTRSQQFTGRAPWDVIAAVVAAVRLRSRERRLGRLASLATPWSVILVPPRLRSWRLGREVRVSRSKSVRETNQSSVLRFWVPLRLRRRSSGRDFRTWRPAAVILLPPRERSRRLVRRARWSRPTLVIRVSLISSFWREVSWETWAKPASVMSAPLRLRLRRCFQVRRWERAASVMNSA